MYLLPSRWPKKVILTIDMNKILLQKIEELTLYTIQQQKEIQELKTELNNLKK